jgi:hypothetical protein
MRSTPSKVGLVDHPEDPLDDVEYICIAADLLHKMFVELQSLAASNPNLARAWCGHGSDAYAHLRTLQETIERLFGVDDLWVATPLIRRATALISWLSDEINELTLCAAGDSFPVESSQVILH